jgi:hypothetical protein
MTEEEDEWIAETARTFAEAIETRIVFPEWLDRGLEEAVLGKPLPPIDDMVRFFDVDDDEETGTDVDRGPFDGTMPDGRRVDMVETLPWCTAKARYGWALPAEETIGALLAVIRVEGGIVEAGCGSGYWCAVLRARLAAETETRHPIIACDDASWKSDGWTKRPWTEIEREKADAVIARNQGLATLLLWPDGSGMARDVAKAMAPGSLLLRGGPVAVTGDREFHAILDSEFDLVGRIPCVKASGGPEDVIHMLRKRIDGKPSPGRISQTTFLADFERTRKLPRGLTT